MSGIWKVLAWISLICGLATYGIGWIALLRSTTLWVPTEFWFYDTIAAGIFAVFFLMYATAVEKEV